MSDIIESALATICVKIIHYKPRTVQVYVASEYCCGEMIRDQYRTIYKHPLFRVDKIILHGRVLDYPEAPNPTQTTILYPVILKAFHAHLLYAADYILYHDYVQQAAIFLGASAPKSAPAIDMSEISLTEVIEKLFIDKEHMTNRMIYKRMQANLKWKR